VRIAHVSDVRNQLVDRLDPVHERRRAYMPWPSPGSQVNFVGVEGTTPKITAVARCEPLGVVPRIPIEGGHQRAVLGTQLHGKAVRIRFQEQISLAAAYLVFVLAAGADAWNEQLPDAR